MKYVAHLILVPIILFGQPDGSGTLDFLQECEMLDPDDNLIEIKGFAQGVVNAQ